MRRACAKNLVDQGISLDRAARILGDESLGTTAIYKQPNVQVGDALVRAVI